MPQTFDQFLDATESTDSVVDEAGEPEALAPDLGQGEAEGTPTPEPSYFDLSEHADKVVKVKSNGQDVEVPVSELSEGWLRQADYTRKTQELAAQAREVEYARQLQEALKRDPRGTISELAMRALQAQTPKQEPLDPVQAELQALRQEIGDMREYQSTQVLARELAQLQSELGPDFNQEEVARRAYQFADQTGVVPSLRDVFYQMQGEKLWAQNSARQELDAERTAGDAKATAAKAAASQLFGGHSALGGGAPIGDDADLSLAEIVRRAVDGEF